MRKIIVLIIAVASVVFMSSSAALAGFAVGDCYRTQTCTGNPILANVTIDHCGPNGGVSFRSYADQKCYGEQWVRDAAATSGAKPVIRQGPKTMRQ